MQICLVVTQEHTRGWNWLSIEPLKKNLLQKSWKPCFIFSLVVYRGTMIKHCHHPNCYRFDLWYYNYLITTTIFVCLPATLLQCHNVHKHCARAKDPAVLLPWVKEWSCNRGSESHHIALPSNQKAWGQQAVIWQSSNITNLTNLHS